MKRSSLIIGLTFLLASNSHGYTCDRTPKKADNPKPNIDRYVIEVSENPTNYTPEKEYTIILKSSPSDPNINTFSEFILVVEPKDPSEAIQDVQTGDLTPVDHSIARFTSSCRNAVIQTNNLAKSNVVIKWKAPPSGSGCVEIKATVYESSDSWFTDDGGLTKQLCEEQENPDVQPPHFEECGACNEAKYEVAFQGMWTRNTHPKDYPHNMWSTKLGEVIGCSHKYDKSFWNYDSEASDGLKLLAEDGNTTILEDELKELVKSDDIRTIIKARELSYPNITGTSYTVFRVDQEHHLISLVSKITPSPDWIVGVANLELCTQDGEWVQSRTLNLYPWDVGTDDGTTYDSQNSPSSPKKAITKIRSEDQDSPFHGESIKPIAQLQIIRKKLYEKCEGTQSPAQEDDECKPSEWSQWSTCSTFCAMTRDRQLLKPENEEKCATETPLQETTPCEITSECENSECLNANWSAWTPCNVTCGSGTKTRRGRLPSDESTEENGSCEDTVLCDMPECEEETTTSTDDALAAGSQILTQGASYVPVVHCKVSMWSDWEPCSATEPCATGYQIKERHIEIHPRNGGRSCPRKLQKRKRCHVPCSGETKVSSSGIDCKMGPWSEWSPCSSNCGSSSVQQRTRVIERHPRNGGRRCENRIEERKCSLPFTCNDRAFLSLNRD